MAYGRSAGFLWLRAREIHEPRAIVLAVQQAALDHDLQQLAHARRRRRVGQLRSDLFHRRAMATMHDVHDLALAPGEMNPGGLRHRPMANYFAVREYIRHTRSMSRVSHVAVWRT